MTMPEFFASCAANPWGSNVLNYALTLETFSRAFKGPNLRLVSYDSIVDGGGNLLQHFLETFLGFTTTLPVVSVASMNKSYDQAEIEIIRALNSVGWSRSKRRGATLREAYFKSKPELKLDSLFEIMNRYTSYLEMNERASNFEALHRKLYDEYGAVMVDPKPDGHLFPPEVARLKYVSQDYLFDEGALSAIQELYNVLQPD